MVQGNYGMQNGHMTPQPGMMYGSTMMTPSRGVAGMPMVPGPRPFMPQYPQTANRQPGAFPGMPQGQTASPHPANSQHMVPPLPPPRPPSPMFVSVPPRTQRLLHSEAYLRYIEGLNAESKTIGDWDKTLAATQENTTAIPESRLPTHWLGQGAGYHGNVTSALWALRDHMLKDALSVQRIIPFDDL